MDDQELRALVLEILEVVRSLAAELERYRELLPEPGTIKARLGRRRIAAAAVEHWTEGG